MRKINISLNCMSTTWGEIQRVKIVESVKNVRETDLISPDEIRLAFHYHEFHGLKLNGINSIGFVGYERWDRYDR
jgi:hypothetical protein